MRFSGCGVFIVPRYIDVKANGVPRVTTLVDVGGGLEIAGPCEKTFTKTNPTL